MTNIKTYSVIVIHVKAKSGFWIQEESKENHTFWVTEERMCYHGNRMKI